LISPIALLEDKIGHKKDLSHRLVAQKLVGDTIEATLFIILF